MCGRIACNLCREEYQNACTYLNETNGKYVRPEWVDMDNAGLSFQPSNNTCPSDVTPVLISKQSFEVATERCIVPMMWGLIPRWHKGEPKKHGLSTTNCRIEGINNLDSKNASKLYASPLNNGKRCVVICEGYYEWQTTKDVKQRQPYYIYAKQDENIKVEDASFWKNGEWTDEKGWSGPVILKMAAIYDVWEAEKIMRLLCRWIPNVLSALYIKKKGVPKWPEIPNYAGLLDQLCIPLCSHNMMQISKQGDRIYSYSIITMESNSTLSWLHHRMPAILTNENILQEWLDTERVSSSRAVSLLPSATELAWHAVSTKVNNSRNKDPSCNEAVKNEINKKSYSPLKNWLQTGSMKKKASLSDETPSYKKPKE